MLTRQCLLAAFRTGQKSTFLQKMGKPNVVFVLGGPGAGKGTQCCRIVESYGYVHLSAGELLREERARKESEVGQLIEGHIRNGTIVPVEITCGLLEAAMTKHQMNDKNDFVIDGFPRNKENLDGWDRVMADKANLKFVLFFDCDDQVCVDRCLERGQGGSGRSDDNQESLKKRIQTYNESTMPIIEHFEKLGLIRTIDASKSVDEVFSEVKTHFS